MTNKNSFTAFILITILGFSSLFCMEYRKDSPKAITLRDVLSDKFPYLKEKPSETNMSETNMSDFISTEEITVVAAIFNQATKEDVVFFDYDEVLVINDKINNKNIPVDDKLLGIFTNTKENSNVYILSTGNNFFFETSLGFIGTEIAIKPYLIIPEDLKGLSPVFLSNSEDINKYSIDFRRNNITLDNPILSMYPKLGSFQTKQAHWCQDYNWSDIPYSTIQTELGLEHSSYPISLLRCLYAVAPIKGKIMASILSILRQNMNGFVPQNIYFIDDSLLNCQAFFYHVKELKKSGFYTGNVKVIHFSKIKKDPKSLESSILGVLQRTVILGPIIPEPVVSEPKVKKRKYNKT